MALPDLTGQNIENTYQRVLQTDGTVIYDGTGSAFLPVSASYAVTASYAEYAVSASHEIIKEVSSSYADYAKESGLSTSSISASYALTASYALNSPDTFPYTGSAIISGSLEVIGDITGSNRLNLNNGSNSIIIGKNAVTSNPSTNSVFIGYGARSNSTAGNAVAIGQDAEAGYNNVAIGKSAEANGAYTVSLGWYANQNGSAANSVFIGYNTGRGVSSTNVAVGGRSLYFTYGTGNTILGTQAFDGGGSNNDNNTVLGHNAGLNGSGNVLIGKDAGSTQSLTNKLYIENSNSTTPLIYGEFDNDLVRINGKLFVSNSLDITGSVSASTYYGDGSNLTGISSDPFPYTGSAIISGSLDITGSIITTDNITIPRGKSLIFPSHPTLRGGISIGDSFTTDSVGANFIRIGNSAGREASSNKFIAIGDEAGRSATGQQQIFIGFRAGRGFDNSNNVVVIGDFAAWGDYSNADVDNAVILGTNAGTSVTQTDNIVIIGTNAGYNTEYSSKSVIIGDQAGYNHSGSSGDTKEGNVFIGYQAGYNELGSNQLIIANNSSSALVTGDFANSTFNISGSISASTYYGDGSNLTGISSDPFPYTGDVEITGSNSLSSNYALKVTNTSGADILNVENDGKTSLLTPTLNGTTILSTGDTTLKITDGQSGNQRGPIFETFGDAGGWNGSYDFKTGYNGSATTTSAFKIIGRGSNGNATAVGIGNFGINILESNSTAQLVVEKHTMTTSSRNEAIRLLNNQSYVDSLNDDTYYGIQFNGFNEGARGGSYIGTQTNSNGGYSADFVVLATGTVNDSYSEIARFVGWNKSFYIGEDRDVIDSNYKLQVDGAVSASTYYGDGSNLTGISSDPFPYTGSAIISGSLTLTGSIFSTDTVTAVTGSFSHLKGNSPITIQDPVTFQHTQGLDVLGNATIHSINEVELQTISKDISYTSSINITEIPFSVNGAIIDYRLTNFNSGSRVGTFMYAHDGTTLSYNDLTIPGAGIGVNPILSASLVNNLVKIDIENAAGFNFTGYTKKFNKLGAPIPIANPNAPIPLLDTYSNAEAAFSLRKLSTLHTGSAIRVREDGSDTEIDIGFDVNNNLDTSTLSAHCGSNNGYIVTWYDQSGNGNNATQTTAANQPQIVSNGNVIFEGGNPVIQGTNSSKLLLNSTIELSSEFSHFTLCTTHGTDNPWGGDASGAEQTTFIYFSNVNTHWRLINSAGVANYSIPNIPGGTLVLQNHIRSTNNSTPLYLNGKITNSPTANGTFYVKAIMGSNWFNYAGRAQEIIFYKSDQSSNREGIETNINTHYNVYDTGLLAEYSGAAAAYSVRLLDSAYTGSALRIREDGTNTETDIGFDSNGDLDTASIASHCGANNGLVTTWYDQSGNGNDAVQSTVGNQPKIYDGSTGVVEENGKPAIDNQGGTYEMLFTPIGHVTNISAVAKSELINFNYLVGTSGDTSLRTSISGNWTGTNNSGDFTYQGSLFINSSQMGSISAQSQRLIFGNSIWGGGAFPQYKLSVIGGTYPNRHWDGPIQEVVLWTTDQSSNRSDIEDNINSYFNIY